MKKAIVQEAVLRCKHAAVVVFVVALLAMGGRLGAQTSTGSVTGRVTDTSGALVPDVSVTVRSGQNGQATHVQSDSSGNFTVTQLQPGTYTIAFERKGFETLTVKDVAVNIAATTTVDGIMKIGSLSESVIVEATEQMLDKSSSTVGTDVPEDITESLPLPERSAMEAVILSPGVQGDPQSDMGVGSENPGIYTGPIAPGASLAVGGGRPGSALQLVDGVDLSMVGYPRVGITFSGDDLQQISVQVGGVPAKYGRAGGGVINQASKGGSLIYHGAFRYRHEDPFFEATTFGQGTLNITQPNGTTVTVPVTQNVHQQLFEALVSGPVPIRFHGINKNTFFLASYEPLRGGSKVFGRTRLPTPAELAGNFANSYTLLNTTILSQQGYAAAVAAPRAGGLDYQFALNAQGFPTGARYTTSTSYQPVPNYDLSAQLNQNAFAKFVLSQFPTPTSTGPYVSFYYPDGSYANDGTNALAARGVQNNDDRYNIRVDHAFGGQDHLYGRYTNVPVRGLRYYFMGPNSPINNQPESQIDSQNALLDYTHIFRSNIINDIHYSYLQMNYLVEPAPSTTSTDFAAKYGLTPALEHAGFPSITIDTGSYGSSTGGNDGGVSNNKTFSVGDEVSIVRGSHTLAFGGEWRALELDRLPNAGIYGGTYSFSTGSTNNGSAGGNDSASFILGEINALTLSTIQKFYYRFKYVSGYAMDSWRATSKLTFNYGLRYNLEFPRTEKYGLQGTVLPTLGGSLNGVNATGAFAFSGTYGLPNTLYPVSYKGFEPRIGFAYAVTNKLVLRGAYSLIHAPMTGVTNSNIPALTPASLNIGNANGGQNPAAWVNYITNPVLLPASGVPGILRGPNPLFTYGTGFLPLVSQSKAVPYTQNWTLGMQYQIGRKTTVAMTYLGNVGHHLFSPPGDTNIMPISTLDSEIQSGTFNFSSTSTPSIYGSVVPSGNANINLLPYPQFANNPVQSAYVRENSASYNALYLSGLHNLGAGISFIGAFTWEKSMDDGSSGSLDGIVTDSFGFSWPQIPNSRVGEWSYSTYDIPTHVTGAFNWTLPIGRGKLLDAKKGWLNALVGGLHTSGIFNAESGYPAWVWLGTAGYFCGTTATKFCGNGTAITTGIGHYWPRPNINPGVPLKLANWRQDPYNATGNGGFVNTAAFSIPGSYQNPTFGNAPRTLGLRSPHTIYFDMHASKDIPLHGDRWMLTIGADAINAFNHTNFFLNPNSGHNIYTGINSSYAYASGPSPSNLPFTLNATYGALNSANNTPGRTWALSGVLKF